MNYSPRIITRLIILSLFFFLSFIQPTSMLYAKENKLIKVGYPMVRNFTDKKDDLYTGYAYDYLREIAIYTGWEYEFIEMDLASAMEALREGEIDLVAGMLKNEQTAELFDFPSFDIGSTYTTLSVLEDSPYWNSSGYLVLDGIRVGYYGTSNSRLINLMSFARINGIQNMMLVPYKHASDREDLVEKLRTHDVDVLLGNDLSLSDEEKVLARFNPTHHYLATTKGNTTLTQQLDNAIAQIKKRNPDFEANLYARYFEHATQDTLILSKAQSDYLKSLSPIKAVYMSHYIPAQYSDPVTNEAKGDFIDTVRLLGEKLGITFEFIPADTYEEAYKMIREHEVDVIVGIADNYFIADSHDFILTPHYTDLELTKIINVHKTTEDSSKVIALIKDKEYLNLDFIYDICYYDTIDECLEAVSNGDAYATYINVNAISHYLGEGDYPDLAVLPQIQKSSVALGLSKSLDPELIQILHKAVYYLANDPIIEDQVEHTYQIKRAFNMKLFLYKHFKVCLIGFTTLLILMGLYIRLLAQKTRIDALTGIYNRAACERYIPKYLSKKRPSAYSAFIIIDIDHFKQINDRFGHKTGDHLLVEFSKLLKKSFAREGLSFRLGGDEFVIFIKNLDNCPTYKLGEKLEELRSMMHKTIEHQGVHQEISLSIGAVITNQILSFNTLYTAADEALYEVKRSGRNNYRIKEYI